MVLLDLSNQNLTKIPVILDDVTELNLSYNQITKIENLPDSLQILILDNNKITKIENLPNSLQKLWLGNNQITKIENLPENLQTLYLYNNQITKIENLPENLQTLYLYDNQITKIENLPDSLQKLWLGNNQITKIENLPDSLQELYLYHNQISKIENLPDSLQQLSLVDNKITELPLSLLELRYIRYFYHHDNPIENIHPLVQRWLERLNRGTIGGNNKVYSDGQNIHNSTIQKSFRNSLGNLLKDKNKMTLDECKKHVLECNELGEQVKRELLNYCDDNTEHSVYLVKFDEVFQYVISRIVKHSDSNEMFKILNEEIKDTICKCFTGRMTRLVNVLNGFYDDITIQIGSNEQISNIILVLQKKYEGDELVKQVRLEMEERSYDEETIGTWLSFL